jgi:hypothetical protein
MEAAANLTHAVAGENIIIINIAAAELVIPAVITVMETTKVTGDFC